MTDPKRKALRRYIFINSISIISRLAKSLGNLLEIEHDFNS
jgi:hypothetical protein